MPRRRRFAAPTLAAAAALCVALSAAACAPAAPSTGEPGVSDPVAAAVDAALARYTSTERVRAILVTVDGRDRFERYQSAVASDYQPVWSVTKSVVSTLVGMAVEEGRVRLDDTLAQLLPDRAALMTPAVARVTLRQLLTMTAGFTDTWSGSVGAGLWAAPDWTQYILRHQDVPPGREFHYSDHGVHLLSPILVRATGQPVLAYARTKLFDPLGISTTPAREPVADEAHLSDFLAPGFAWSVDPAGLSTTAGGLKLRPRDLAAFGQLFLQGGRWEGRQLVAESWVRQATKGQVGAAFTLFRPMGAFDPTDYGYLWWVDSVAGHPAFFAHGFGGQLVKVVPALRLVIVMSSFVDATRPGAVVVDPDQAQEVADAIATAVAGTRPS